MNLLIDNDYLTESLSNLVRINSTNPSLAPDGAGEAEIGAYVADALSALGLEVTTYKLGPDRVNVVGILRGTGSGRSPAIQRPAGDRLRRQDGLPSIRRAPRRRHREMSIGLPRSSDAGHCSRCTVMVSQP